eukprot:TRINITY_DN2456_c6_g1_i1.p1 TRINITY_DN2456_c6_g1~~TRINITY_DN2456_c6_g1_i1.p1  ORF type:complete len:239 (+),score=59.03 TRINITY_DN2456_c6_g1_i1:81-797(+)
MSRATSIYFAKMAEEAGRYDEMAQHMEAVGKRDEELSVEERKLLAAAYHKAVANRREAWRMITSLEQKETSEGKQEQAKYAREYCGKIEAELQELCSSILALLDGTLIGEASDCESKVFYTRMKGDHYRYLAEVTSGNDKAKAAEHARKAYEAAVEIAERNLCVSNPVRLGLMLSYSSFQYDVLQSPEQAVRTARTAFEDAIADKDIVEETYKEGTEIMQMLRDNITLWISDHEEGSQ